AQHATKPTGSLEVEPAAGQRGVNESVRIHGVPARVHGASTPSLRGRLSRGPGVSLVLPDATLPRRQYAVPAVVRDRPALPGLDPRRASPTPRRSREHGARIATREHPAGRRDAAATRRADRHASRGARPPRLAEQGWETAAGRARSGLGTTETRPARAPMARLADATAGRPVHDVSHAGRGGRAARAALRDGD